MAESYELLNPNDPVGAPRCVEAMDANMGSFIGEAFKADPELLFGWLDSRISAFFLRTFAQNRLSRSFAYFSTRLPLALDLEHFAMTAWKRWMWDWQKFAASIILHTISPQNGRGWGPYNATILWKMFLKMGSSLPFCSDLWVLAGFIIFSLKAWSFMGTKTNHFCNKPKAML